MTACGHSFFGIFVLPGMKLYIRNMVCNRCILAVEQVLHQAGITPQRVALGEVTLFEPQLPEAALASLDQHLRTLGFERIDDRKGRMIENIKSVIIQRIHHSKEVEQKHNWSVILAEAMHYDYNYLSNLFSSVEGITIEQYIIRQKIEKAKELLFYDERTLSQIADQLGYSSVAHLSAQFKKVTGLTPSEVKKFRQPENVRKPLDEV
jgi:AraC family transcriptional regulator